ncbi:MAG: hypothetical protein ACSHWZ_02190 [Sulfitobacter sp.]
MSGFFRPEARAALWRWREVLAGGGAAALGLWWIAAGRLLVLPGYGMLALGAALVVIGIQRARFRGPGGGVGTVQVDEGQVIYFGPLSGGAVALAELERLSLDGRQLPAHWRLEQAGQAPLMIPVNADGAEGLFDAFASLPGLRTQAMLAELQRDARQAIVIWERKPARPTRALLH